MELEEAFPDLAIDIGKVHLNEKRGISIRHLECHVPVQAGMSQRVLFTVDELFLECPVTIHALYRKEVRIDKVVLKNPIVRLARAPNGCFEEWKRFRIPQKEAARPIPIEVHNGIVLYEDAAVSQTAPLKITGITLSITPPETGSRPVLLTDLEKKGPPSDAWKASGNAKGDLFRQLDFEGHFDPEDGSWQLTSTCRQFDWTPHLLDFLPWKRPLIANPDYQKSLESFQGRFDLDVSARSDPRAEWGFRFELDGVLSQGRAELYEIDRTLSELSTRFRVTDEGLRIEKLMGIAEAARLVVSYSQEGLRERRRAVLSADVRGLTFDGMFVKALYPFLNGNTKLLLERFEYSGTTDLNSELVFQDGVWKPRSLDLKLSDLSFSFLPFPYKLERLSGELRIDDEANLRFNFLGRNDESFKTRIAGAYRNILVDPVGQVQIWGENVPIDARLMNALPDEHRDVVLSLNPTGAINANLRIGLPPDDLPIEKYFAIGLNNVAVQYERFPYPLRGISGWLCLEDDAWTFQNIVGTNESATVRCDGHLKPVLLSEATEPTMEFLMKIHAEELPVDGQLVDALLDAGRRELLAGLRARGKIGLDAQIRYLSRENRLNLEFVATPCQGLSIFPVRFPYRIENVQGEIHYKDGVVYSELLKGNNRETRLRSGVFCRFAPNGQWMLRLDPLSIDQLSSNRELSDALPPNLQSVIENLQVGKPFNLKGMVEFSGQGESSPFRAVWDAGIVLHQNDMDVGIPIRSIFGEIRLTGYSENDDFRLAGELKLDSAMIRGFQANHLSGPFFFDGKANQFFIGQPAMKVLPPPPEFAALQEFHRSPWFVGAQQARPVLGRLFDGTLMCEGLVVLGNGISYSIHTDLAGADLVKIAQELEPGARKIAGTLNCRSHFRGEGRKMETLEGNGAIELRNANIYEAPGMVRLLRELSIREIDPNAGAFDSADIQFRLLGNNVFFRRILFEGGAFSLIGQGEMRIDNRNVKLLMKTRLGNRRTQIPIVSDILGGASDQIVQLSIQGPISDPTVSRIPLPEFQKLIQQFQGEETIDYGNFSSPPSAPRAAPSRLRPSALFPWH